MMLVHQTGVIFQNSDAVATFEPSVAQAVMLTVAILSQVNESAWLRSPNFSAWNLMIIP